MQDWKTGLDEHHLHQSFRVETWVESAEVGFTCSCDGEERTWRLSIKDYRSLIPETRDMFKSVQIRFQNRGAKEIAKAEKKARDLLFRHLTKEQKYSLRANNYFTVVGQDGAEYQITMGSCQNIYSMVNGERYGRFCFVPVDTKIPTNDSILAQKLMLEHDIEGFMRVANFSLVSPIGPIQKSPWGDPDVTFDDAREIDAWANRALQNAIVSAASDNNTVLPNQENANGH